MFRTQGGVRAGRRRRHRAGSRLPAIPVIIGPSMSGGGGLSELAARGEEALRAGDWEGARSAFEAALDLADSPAAHDGLWRALWWLGDPDGAIEHRERAFVLLKGLDPRRAGAMAIWLAREHRSVHGNEAAANGWL